MGLRLKTFGLIAGLLYSLTVEAQQTTTVGILEFAGKQGVPQEIADVLAEVLADKIMRMGEVKVVTRADILSMVDLEEHQRVTKCTDKECVSEVGGALGVAWMVSGNVSRFGEIYLLNLKLYDVRNADIPSRVSKRVKGGEEALLDELLVATTELFEKVADRLALVPTVSVASRHVQLLAESPSAVNVYSREEIRSSGALSMAEFLRRVPGFDVYELKPSYPLVGARALTEDSNNLVLVLLDGKELNIELSGFPLWNVLGYDIEEVERVEVIRGPGSALYGANAFAAVVSITTLAENPDRGADVYLSGGEVGRHRLFARVRDHRPLGEGVLSYRFGGGLENMLSPSDPSDPSVAFGKAHGYVRYRIDQRLDLSLHLGYVKGDGILHVHMGDMYLRNAYNFSVMGQAGVVLSETLRLKSQLYYDRNAGDFLWRTGFRAFDIWIADFGDFFWDSPSLDGQAQLEWQPADNFLLIGGTNLRYTALSSPDITMTDDDELRWAAFFHMQWNPWSQVQLTAGLRFDYNTDTEPALSPRVALVFRPWPKHTFRLGYGLAFRKPSHYESRWHPKIDAYNQAVPEIIDKAAETISNGDLVNEKVHSIEAGWRAQFFDDRLQATADLFFNFYRDSITFVIELEERFGLPDIRASNLQFENEGAEVNALGGELELSWRPVDKWWLWTNLGIRRVIDKDTDERALSEPVVRVNLGGRYSGVDGIRTDLALHYVSDYQMPLKDPSNLLNPPRPMSLGNKFMVIGRLGYRLVPGKELVLDVGLTFRAPLGSTYREYSGAPMPGTLNASTWQDFGGEVLTRLVTFYLRGTF